MDEYCNLKQGNKISNKKNYAICQPQKQTFPSKLFQTMEIEIPIDTGLKKLRE